MNGSHTFRAALLVVVAAIVLALPAGGSARPAVATRFVDEVIPSIALGGNVHARVFLPATYDTAKGTRYPVIYFLHGLPATSTSYQGNAWLAEALAQAGNAILVLPQGARDDDTDPEYLDRGKDRGWATYITSELPRYIDAHFRTIPSRAGRAIIGLSAGGYGATILGLNNLGEYSVIESWSGYFFPTDPTGTSALNLGPLTVARNVIPTLKADLKKRPTFLAFYVGRSDTRFRTDNEQFDSELDGADIPHVFELYQGAHDTSLWQARARRWLTLALVHLAGSRSA